MYRYSLGLYEKAVPDDLPLEEKFLVAKRTGYDFLEFCVDLNPEREARLDWSKEERRRLVNFFYDNDVRMTTLSLSVLRKTPLGMVDSAANDHAFAVLEKGVELAADLGAQIVLINGYDVFATPSTPETAARFAQNIPIAAGIAASRGVILAIENAERDFMDSVTKAAQWVDKVNSPYFRIYGDVGNIANATVQSGADPLADLEAGRGRIAAMHLKDSMPGEYRFTRYGEGQVDFARSVALIKDMDIRVFTAELFCQPQFGYEEEAARVNKFLRSFF